MRSKQHEKYIAETIAWLVVCWIFWIMLQWIKNKIENPS